MQPFQTALWLFGVKPYIVALIYTALTRAKCNLFIINLGNPKYDSFFKTNIK